MNLRWCQAPVLGTDVWEYESNRGQDHSVSTQDSPPEAPLPRLSCRLRTHATSSKREPKSKISHVGLQLYTLRHRLEESVGDALDCAARAGYSGLELFGGWWGGWDRRSRGSAPWRRGACAAWPRMSI